MKLTDEIVRALHGCIECGFDSVQDFARFTNVSANTIMKYMRKETGTINRETWAKIAPLLKNYLPRSHSGTHGLELDSDAKILLDAFTALPADVRSQKLLEIVELAKKEVRKLNRKEIPPTDEKEGTGK